MPTITGSRAATLPPMQSAQSRGSRPARDPVADRQVLEPTTKLDWIHSGSPASSTCSSRRASSAKSARCERRARCEPRQKCSPWPKPRWRFGSRSMRKRKGSSKTSSSRLRRGVEEAQPVALADLLAADLGVAGRLAPHVVHRRRPAHDLLDGRRHEAGVAAQPRQLVRVLEQRAHAAGERVLRGVVAGGEGDQVVAEGLERTHRLAVDLAVGRARWRDRRAGSCGGPR